MSPIPLIAPPHSHPSGYTVDPEKQRLYIVTELMTGGDLEHHRGLPPYDAPWLLARVLYEVAAGPWRKGPHAPFGRVLSIFPHKLEMANPSLPTTL